MLEAEGLPAMSPTPRPPRPRHARRRGGLGLERFARATPSPALTAVVAPPAVDSEKILATYDSSHNITIAGGQGEIKGRVFRLGHMGYVGDFDVITALAALEQVLDELGHPVDWGARSARRPEGLRGARVSSIRQAASRWSPRKAAPRAR